MSFNGACCTVVSRTSYRKPKRTPNSAKTVVVLLISRIFLTELTNPVDFGATLCAIVSAWYTPFSIILIVGIARRARTSTTDADKRMATRAANLILPELHINRISQQFVVNEP
jgi:hypothetical protein